MRQLDRLRLRPATVDDIDAMIALNRLCFPSVLEENVVWNAGQLNQHLKLFPEGQIVVELDGRIVGAVSSLIVNLGVDHYRIHTFAGMTDGGYFHNHDAQGDTLYGADVYVHPDCRGLGIGHALYEARRKLCRALNLRRILAGGRIHGYAEHASTMAPEEYVRAVELDQLRDAVLSFQLREGFVVRKVMRNYIRDPMSKNCATLIEWLNPDYKPRDDSDSRNVRIACVQYQMRGIAGFDEFAAHVEYFVERSCRLPCGLRRPARANEYESLIARRVPPPAVSNCDAKARSSGTSVHETHGSLSEGIWYPSYRRQPPDVSR